MKKGTNERDPLDWLELEGAPNTRGAFSFLTSNATDNHIHEVQAQDRYGVHRERCAAEYGTNALIDTAADKATTVNRTTTVDETSIETVAASRQRPYRLHLCRLAQDGHSHGENRLYEALWHAGRYENESKQSKVITLGWDRMSEEANMSDKAAKRNLIQLVKKLAVEQIAPEDCGARRGRTYRVFSYDLILKRRASAGMRYVVKDKGVRFVDTPNARRSEGKNDHPDLEVVSVCQPSSLNKPSTVDNASTDTVVVLSSDVVDISSMDGVDIPSRDTVDKTSPPLDNSLDTKTKTTATTDTVDVSAVVAALCREFPADLAAGRRIVDSCVARCPECTTADVVNAIRSKALQIRGQSGVRNPIGILLTSCAEVAAAECKLRSAEEAQRMKEKAQTEQLARENNALGILAGFPRENPWNEILDAAKSRVSTSVFDTWLKPTRFAGVAKNTLRVCIPSPEFRHIEYKCANVLFEVVHELGLEFSQIEYVTLCELAEALPRST